MKQFLNNINYIEKNICGFRAHDKAIYTSGPLLNKEEAVEVQEFISIKQLHAEIDRKDSNWLVIQKKLDKITKYYEQEEEEDYDAVNGIGDNLKFILKSWLT